MNESEYINSKNKGIEFYKSTNYSNAYDLLNKYLAFHKDDVQTMKILGEICLIKGDLIMAEKYFHNVLKINPIDKKALINYSRLKLKAADYKTLLKKAHQILEPKRYIEIGVCKGESLKLADNSTIAIGIDPNPQLNQSELSAKHKVIKTTSDDYFNQGSIEKHFHGKSFDMAFLDGMHLFEFVLRDFINLEKNSSKNSIIFVHDLYPINSETATRERNSDFWSGDVWKLVLCLKEYRPELDLQVLPSPPTGLGVIKNLDSNSKILSDKYEEILKKYKSIPFNILEKNKDKKLMVSDIDNHWLTAEL